jgi:rare lipoprotein A
MEIQSTGSKIEIQDLKIERSIQKASSKWGSKDSFSELLKAGVEKEISPPESIDKNPIEYIVKPGDSLWKIGRMRFNKDPYQIAKENGISRPNLIKPGQKLMIYADSPNTAPPLEKEEVTASWYGAEHHNKITASGQRYDMNKKTLAHKNLPFGTKVRLINPENGKTAEGVVNDRGPYIKGRDVDISYALAKKLGFVKKGVTTLNIEIM